MRVIYKLVFLLGLAACTYRGDGADPFSRKFAYFSMLNGDDIRSSCQNGVDKYRLVYNGNYAEQVRIYELYPEGLRVRILDGSPNLADGLFSNDPLRPFRGKSGIAELTKSERERIVAAFAKDGLFSGAHQGLRLPSEEFYWLGVGCHQGQIYFNAWLYPADSFKSLSFPAMLLAQDLSGVPYNEPRPWQGFPDQHQSFNLRIDGNGLGGIARLF